MQQIQMLANSFALSRVVESVGAGVPLVQVVLTLVVIGVLLWLINRFIPMQGTIKSILNAVVVICIVIWLLNVFGLLAGLTNYRVGH
jgi:ABC-type long-subunit fatty acid transport system fused permease/ATPase subunit